MGFYINGDDEWYLVDGLKQHINLSEFALNIIEDDISNFYLDQRKPSFSGFLNTIFANFYPEANSAISQRYTNKNDELQQLFTSKEFKSFDSDITNLYIDKMLVVYQKELEEKANSYKKGVGKKFRINKANLSVLRNSTESIHYNDSIGNYLKAIYEEYALLPSYKREEIFFKDKFHIIENAILNKRKLKFNIMRKIDPKKGDFYIRKFYLSPFEIIQDKNNTYNYIVGYSEEIKSDGTTGDKIPASFRISRIDHIAIMNSMNASITKADLKSLETEIAQKGVQYLAGEIVDVIIKFNDKGFEAFERTLYMRPKIEKKLKDNTFLFKTTKVQAINYFFKMGRDIEVIEPEDLRSQFIRRYQSALDVYIK